MTNLSNVELADPKTVQRQTMRSNVEYDSLEEYYRQCSFISFLDSLLQELQGRFQGKAKICQKNFSNS